MRRRTTFARCRASSDDAREIHRILLDDLGASDLVAPDETFPFFVGARPLSRDYEFWDFDGELRIALYASLEFSEESVRRELVRCDREISIVHPDEFYNVVVYIERYGDGYRVQPCFVSDPNLETTLQEKLRRERYLASKPVWRRRIGVNLFYSNVEYVPCRVDLDTGEQFHGHVLCTDIDDAINCYQTLRDAFDFPPAKTIGRNEVIKGAALQSYPQLRSRYAAEHRLWTTCLSGRHRHGFDPFLRPEEIPEYGWCFPLARKEGLGGYSDFGADLIHLPEGSYLEIDTAFGLDRLQEIVASLSKWKWEIWHGSEFERWDGDSSPVEPPPPRKPAPPLMYKQGLDQAFPCFVDEGVLTLYIRGQADPRGPDCANVPRHSPDGIAYTKDEIGHLGYWQALEANFDQIAARYSGWTSIRFWWPYGPNDKFYWSYRPTLRQLKSLPMRIRGEVLEVPVEIVEPMKCPM